MKIKNKMILDDNFLDAFLSLLTLPMSAKQCLEVSSSVDEISGQRKIVQRTRRAIIERLCKKDSAGKVLSDGAGNILFENEESKKECMEELVEVLEEEVDISLNSIIKVDSSVTMTPLKVKLLKDIIEIIN
jgi:predicted transcriptional regulator